MQGRAPFVWQRLALAAGLFVATLALYAPVRDLPFLLYDDEQYVTRNPDVQAGLSADGLVFAFTSFHASNWHPLTWLSHQADATFFGPSARGPHLVNAGLHALNAALVFLWLAALTGATWQSAAVAALFAFHPQRVESVAWVAERKDLLCACFGLLALLAWTRFARAGSRRGYALALVCMALGLLAKPMLVSLPLLLCVLDFWPLRRGLRIVEKLPFVALAAASSLVTLLAQRGAITPHLPLGERVASALVALETQLAKAFWPVDLAVLYPHPLVWPAASIALAIAVVGAAAVGAFLLRRRAPWVAAGLAWFALGLGPTLGLVQVGFQFTADRYAYLPQIGVWLALVWSAAELRIPRVAFALPFAAALAWFALATRAQLVYWRDDLALWTHAVAVTERNWFGMTELGIELAARGRLDEAQAQLTEAVKLAPRWERAHANLGFVWLRSGRPAEAAEELAKALALDPSTGGLGERHYYLAVALEQAGRKAEAAAEYEAHLALLPDDTRARQALARLGATPGR